MATAILRILKLWTAVELFAACVLISSIVGLVFYQVVARSFFGAPLAWAEEAGTVMFIWIVFIGASVAMKMGRHVSVEALEHSVGPRGTFLLRQFGRLLTITTMLAVAWLIAPFISVESRSTSVSLPIDLPRSWFFSIPLMLSCLSMSLGAILLFVADLLAPDVATGRTIAEAFLHEDAEAAGKF